MGTDGNLKPTATPSPCRGPSQGQEPFRSVRGPGVSSCVFPGHGPTGAGQQLGCCPATVLAPRTAVHRRRSGTLIPIMVPRACPLFSVGSKHCQGRGAAMMGVLQPGLYW